MQQLRSRLVAQFARPHGVWGSVAGAIMATRSSNRVRNEWVLDLLDLPPNARVLEIGFGPGIAIERATARVTLGRVYGVDHSPVMLQQATRRNRAAIDQGRLELHLAPAESIPRSVTCLTHVFAVNSALFWKSPEHTVRELRERLVPGGLLAIGHQPRGKTTGATEAVRQGRAYEATLGRVGYESVRMELTRLGSETIVCVLGRSPSHASPDSVPTE